jgi:hypothetical protein
MKAKTRPPGRPKNRDGTITLWRFARAGMVMSAFDEARESGEKYSAAVTQAVDDVRQRHPKMPVSESEVRRTLAIYRPKNSRTVLRFNRSAFDDEKLARLRLMLEQVPTVQGEKNLPVPPPSIKDLPKNLAAVTFGYFERPLYPRHNRKIPKK